MQITIDQTRAYLKDLEAHGFFSSMHWWLLRAGNPILLSLSLRVLWPLGCSVWLLWRPLQTVLCLASPWPIFVAVRVQYLVLAYNCRACEPFCANGYCLYLALGLSLVFNPALLVAHHSSVNLSLLTFSPLQGRHKGYTPLYFIYIS